MSPSKADRLITRITALHHSLEMDKDVGPSSLERDLMLGYLRELYDFYLNAGDRIIEERRKKDEATPTEPASPKYMAPASAPTPPPAPPTPAPREVIDVPPPPVMEPSPPVISTVRIVPSDESPTPVAKASIDPEVQALFEQEEGMSNPMMRQKVSDLTRALSINNRVLFANKLFGNDNEALTVALRDLNLKGSMEYARPTLTDLAARHRWTEPQRLETAREFIDLVRRRYA